MRRLLAHAGLVIGGVVAAFALIAGIELALRVLDIGGGQVRRDPFAGFSRTLPLFEARQMRDGTPVFRLSAARQRVTIGRVSSERQRAFTQKVKGAFRIFVVGDSSAAGVPYGTGYAFSYWLAQQLHAELPDVRTEVVNAAIPGYASRRVLVAVEEIAAYEPDLVVVYVGHNEFAERRFYAHLLELDPRLFRLAETLVGSRLYGLISSLRGSGPEPPPKLDPDDRDEALQMFSVLRGRADGSSPYPSPRELAWGENHYRFNLEQMVRRMHAVGARVLLVGQAQNFSDWPPAASEHRSGLSDAELSRWDEAYAEGRRLAAHEPENALAAFARAGAIDADYAELAFEQAGCERALGRYDAARESYRRASDLDRVPHGAPTRYNAIEREVAESEGALFVDADAALERISEHRLVGASLFADSVHPNLQAHLRIAAAIADTLRAADLPLPAARWQPQRWQPPAVETLYAGDPSLVIQELLIHAFTCRLANRTACALSDAEAVLARDADNPMALSLRTQLQSGQSWPP